MEWPTIIPVKGMPDGMVIIADTSGLNRSCLIYNVGEVRYAVESEAKSALLDFLRSRLDARVDTAYDRSENKTEGS